MNERRSVGTRMLLLSILALGLVGRPVRGAEYVLRAASYETTSPCMEPVTMWGWALDSSFGALDGTPTSPGPVLTVTTGDPTLTIHVDNDLPVATSIVIPGQIAQMTPERNGDGRVRSFTHETPPGNGAAVTYTWTDLRPGTYLYHSGTHPAVQVQMGLHGAVKKDAAAGEAYPGVPYDKEVLLLYSEIDPVLHAAVATGNYGPGLAVTSTMDHHPRYFLINGEPHSGRIRPETLGVPGERVLFRLLNASIETLGPMLKGPVWTHVAEDGWPYRWPKEDRWSMTLTALKTKDAVATVTTTGIYGVLERRLRLTNGPVAEGGMLYQFAMGTEFCPADMNMDGQVDWQDADALVAEMGGTGLCGAAGDLDGDHDVDWDDYFLLSAQFGKTGCPRP